MKQDSDRVNHIQVMKYYVQFPVVIWWRTTQKTEEESKVAKSNRMYYAMILACMFFWGGSWVSGKILVDVAPPFTIGFFRFAIASVFFLPLLLLRKDSFDSSLSRSDYGYFVLLGLTGIFGYGILFLTGMRFTTAAQGSIIAGFNPASVSIFAHIIHKEELESRWRYVGFVLSFLGIVFVIGVQSLINFRLEYLIGNLLILCAMIIWGIYSSIGKAAMNKMSSIQATAGGTFVGAGFFAAGAVAEGFWSLPAMTNPVFWLQVAFLGILVTFVSFLFYFHAIRNLGATQTSVFINLVPVFGTSLSIFLLQEPIYWTFIVGLVLVVLGILVINYPKTHSEKSKTALVTSEDT
ncbi:MAG: DMT family transporter [Candidatus Thorarchaeota archaeon]